MKKELHILALIYATMMHRLYLILIFVIFFTLHQQLMAQEGVGIGTSTPHESAVLDVFSESGTRGMLVPRIPNRNNVANPREGLIIYHEATDAFEYYDGAGWVQLIPTPAKFNIDMAGNQIIGLANGTANNHAVNKGQLDAVDNANLDRDGTDAMTGNLNMNSRRILNVSNGTNNGDAINKSQLDALEAKVIALENQIGGFTYLRRGTVTMRDLPLGDTRVLETFPSVGPDNYTVIGTLRSSFRTADPNFDNDITYVVDSKTEDSFTLVVHKIFDTNGAEIRFDYILFREN